MSELTAEWELRLQQFLDQELSAEERVEFIARLGRDAALRERAVELEQLLLATAGIPPPPVPSDFGARIMQAADVRQPQWRRAMQVMWAPRAVHWNLAAVSAACVALLAAGAIFYGSLMDRPASSRSTVLVRLVIVQPGARTVQVAGDFNGWTPAPLVEISDGAWAVTLSMEPGRYEYMYVIDGTQWIADPFAAEQNEDGFGSRNAVLEVRSPVPSHGAPL